MYKNKHMKAVWCDKSLKDIRKTYRALISSRINMRIKGWMKANMMLHNTHLNKFAQKSLENGCKMVAIAGMWMPHK